MSEHASVPHRIKALVPTRNRLAAGSLAASTRHAYEARLRQFDQWLDGLPPTDRTLASYLARLFEKGLAPATAEQTVAAAKRRAKEAGEDDPAGPETRAVLGGFRREAAGRGPGQAVGIGWEQADRMALLALAEGTLRGARDAAMIAVASDGLLRASEVEALDAEDIVFLPEGALVAVRRSKTDQEREGSMRFAGPSTARLLGSWMKQAGIEAGALFRPVGKGDRAGSGRLGRRSVGDAVKRRAAGAGIEGRATGHSLRIGAAQSLMAAGATLAELM